MNTKFENGTNLKLPVVKKNYVSIAKGSSAPDFLLLAHVWPEISKVLVERMVCDCSQIGV